MILLGGDLFDEANPSNYCINQCFKLLRNYCMGDKPISIEFVSDQGLNFMESLNKTVNYEDPNLNVAVPVFSIHGNHDDPSGFANLSSLDLLSTVGYLNYFGKWTDDLTKVKINPIMLTKGVTKLGIYGLSYIHDNRLCRLFADRKVEFPVSEDVNNEWFNLMVVHQNRANRGVKNYLPEESLPTFLDFVLWGHEHDCLIAPQKNVKKNFFVCQPGSTVATSLAEGESGIKQCAVLKIYKKDFKLEPIRLKTVRPFVFDTLRIRDFIDDESLVTAEAETCKELAEKKIEEMIKEAEKLRTDDPNQPKMPLIRLRIEITKENQMFNTIRFGQNYISRVANPDDIILFKRPVRRMGNNIKVDKEGMDEAYSSAGDINNKLDDVLKRYFEEIAESRRLKVMSNISMSELLRRIVECQDTSKTDVILDFYIKKALDHLKDATLNDFDEKLESFHDTDDQCMTDLLTELDKSQQPGRTDGGASGFYNDDSGSDENNRAMNSSTSSTKKPARGRGRAAANKGGTSTRGRGRGRGSTAATSSNNTTSSRMNPLNFSTSSKTKQPNTKNASAKPASNVTYEISDDSDN